jgi:hypothetical protein
MLLRDDPSGAIAVSQPTHAWLSGQLARAWGNERFGRIEPAEELCLGAELHDLGWTGWEQEPTVHPRSGRPRRFFELPTADHVALWRGASRRALTYGRYPALLVSLHVTHLYERHDFSADTPAEADAARAFLADERAFQEHLLASLHADPHYQRLARPEAVARNQRLVAVWDRLSLALCIGLGDAIEVPDVPSASAPVSLHLRRVGADVEIDPWPFGAPEVTVVAEGRRLPGTFSDDAALRAALAAAPWAAFSIILRPALRDVD